jgi:hypothetical protein
MNPYQPSELYIAALVTLVVAAMGFAFFEGGKHWGKCEERWSHAVTPIDTLRIVQQGCRLP